MNAWARAFAVLWLLCASGCVAYAIATTPETVIMPPGQTLASPDVAWWDDAYQRQRPKVSTSDCTYQYYTLPTGDGYGLKTRCESQDAR
jgi:hypothetical protein